MKSIWSSLATFRTKIEVVKKDANNPFFKSKYADLPSILDAIKKPLHESWLALVHNTLNSESWYVCVTTIIDIESGEYIKSEFPVFWTKPQEVWSSISYARRYNIQALLDIPTDDDDDGNNANTAPRTKSEYVWWPVTKWLNFKDMKDMIENRWYDTEELLTNVIKDEWWVLSKDAKNALRHYCDKGEIISY